MPDGQKVKDLDFNIFEFNCTGKEVDPSEEMPSKDTGMSERLCPVFDIIYNKYLDNNKAYLFFDCGCSDGRVVEHLQNNYPNIIASGCEVAHLWIKYANSKNRNVFYADVNDPDTFGKRRFDIILSSKVLNLTKNFRTSLLCLCDLLFSGGIIILLFGFTTNQHASHYCLIESPDIVTNWINNYNEFKNIEVVEVIYKSGEFQSLVAEDEVIIVLRKHNE